ncbi:winged helix-turn-helix transcriptional regulator [Actinopolymorpha pittospori]|uniref:DNA-binding HxlR family transcriptional regulator n=1 Tax=Actinopolymorpha pittospori TaxID=648752 RepID=A0A927MR53_9ACTN|nr:DNA-binding HxlR family transcriptional regulator [Actinopolymorpha pittospori]
MSPRRYAQFCPLAKALDILGERWTLLIIRELLAGPKRYTDLRAGLAGLATDLLATRLRELRAHGLVERRDLPPPTPATVYELTERGRALRPAILELARWGRPLLREAAHDALPDSALVLGLEAAFHAAAAVGVDETYDIEVDGQRVAVRVRNGTLTVLPGGTGDRASVRINTDREGFMSLARSDSGTRPRIDGDPDALARFQRIFALD